MSKKCAPLWRQNVQNTPGSDHFWKLIWRKSARHCGAKHISKSKCIIHTMFGLLLKVVMSKKRTPLWREAHFEVKMLKTLHVRTTFRRSDVVSRGRHNTRDKLCTQLSIFEASLAGVACSFWCCQLQKLGTSGRIASFSMLPTSKIGEVLQNCFLFDVIKFKSWGSLAGLLRFQACRLQIADRQIDR